MCTNSELECGKVGFGDSLHRELSAGLLVVDVVVAGLLADFPFAVGGVGG